MAKGKKDTSELMSELAQNSLLSGYYCFHSVMNSLTFKMLAASSIWTQYF